MRQLFKDAPDLPLKLVHAGQLVRRPILRLGAVLFALANLGYPWTRSATSLFVMRRRSD